MKNGTSYWVLGHKISPVHTTGSYDMIIGETPPQTQGPPPHYHAGYEELFLVLEGEMDFVVNGEKKKVGRGQSVNLPANTIHTFQNTGTVPCKWINVHSPKGFLSFFRDMGIAEQEEQAIKKSIAPAVIQTVMEKAASYDMHIKL